jgi:hypothetical protein
VSTVLFDDRTARLRLDRAAFDRLVACAAREPEHDPEHGSEMSALRAAGAVQDGRPHPVLSAGLRAVTRPAYRLRLALLDEQGRYEAGDGWAGDDTAAVLLDLPDGLGEFVTLRPAFLPAAIAHVVRLGPRGRPRWEPLRLPAQQVVELFSLDPTVRRRAARTVYAEDTAAPDSLLPELIAGPWRAWRAETTWTDQAGGGTGRTLDVVDARETGLCLIEYEGDQAVLWPATATVVWRLLIRLLPTGE